VYREVLLSEIRKHSSYMSFGRTSVIGFFIEILISKRDEKAGFGCIPTYKSLNENGILPTLLSKSSG